MKVINSIRQQKFEVGVINQEECLVFPQKFPQKMNQKNHLG